MLECLVTKRFPDAEPCNWRQGERKKHLFVFACVHRIWNLLPTEYRTAFEMWEPDIDVVVSAKTRRAKWAAADRIKWEHSNLLFAIGYDDIGLFCLIAARIAAEVGKDRSGMPQYKEARQQQEQQEQASLLRDIFGNPFRPVVVDPSWLAWNDGTVVKLAQGIYDDRAFNRLPVLADALEEAGCDNADILAHCRGPGEHVRGCFVLDLLLGKE